VISSWGSSGGVSSLLNSAGFILPFFDAGSGAVNTTLYRGTGSATFTRATTATTVNSSGLIVSVASGVARSYYDPTTLAYMGYLAEGARTNLVLNSLIDGTDFSTQSVSVAAVAHTLSFYGTGTITLSGASTAGPLVGTGVYPQRVSLTFTPSAASLTLTVTGSCKFVQLEVGSFASSFIPTAGSSVTRNADVLTYPSAGNVLTATGTVYFEQSQSSNASAGVFLSINEGAAINERITILDTSANGGSRGLVVSGGAVTADITVGSSAAGSVNKRAMCWSSAYTNVCQNATLGTADVSSTMPATFTRIEIGAQNELSPSYGAIRNVRIFQTQLSASQLEAVTQ